MELFHQWLWNITDVYERSSQIFEFNSWSLIINVQCSERQSAVLKGNKSSFLHICNPTFEFLFSEETARQIIKIDIGYLSINLTRCNFIWMVFDFKMIQLDLQKISEVLLLQNMWCNIANALI